MHELAYVRELLFTPQAEHVEYQRIVEMDYYVGEYRGSVELVGNHCQILVDPCESLAVAAHYKTFHSALYLWHLAEHHGTGCAVATDILDGMLLSGGTGKIVIPTELHNTIVIPQEATYSIQDKVYVMKVVDGKAVSTIIQVEPQNNGKEYVVISGLQEGDVIIAKGAGFVEEGTVIVKP